MMSINNVRQVLVWEGGGAEDTDSWGGSPLKNLYTKDPK